MTTGELVLTIVGLISIGIVPVLVGFATGMRRGSGMLVASVIAAVIAIFWAVYWADLAQPHHVKHTALFAVLAVVALVGASFSRPAANVV